MNKHKGCQGDIIAGPIRLQRGVNGVGAHVHASLRPTFVHPGEVGVGLALPPSGWQNSGDGKPSPYIVCRYRRIRDCSLFAPTSLEVSRHGRSPQPKRRFTTEVTELTELTERSSSVFLCGLSVLCGGTFLRGLGGIDG